MKSFVQSSRFVQPKRSAAAENLVSKIGSPKDAPTEPVDQPTFGKIEDVLSNLEQDYDSSTAKWDALRRMEDREHELMRGLASSPNATSTQTLENDTTADSSLPSLPIIFNNEFPQPELTISTDNSSVDEDYIVQSHQDVRNSPDCSPNLPDLPLSANTNQSEWGIFVFWMLVHLFGLWISSTFTTRRG